jgi:hypothetical protein
VRPLVGWRDISFDLEDPAMIKAFRKFAEKFNDKNARTESSDFARNTPAHSLARKSRQREIVAKRDVVGIADTLIANLYLR